MPLFLKVVSFLLNSIIIQPAIPAVAPRNTILKHYIDDTILSYEPEALSILDAIIM